MSNARSTLLAAVLATCGITAQDLKVHLHYRVFDPAQETVAIPAALMAQPASRLFLVQVSAPLGTAELAKLAGAGVTVHQYLPELAYLMRFDGAQRDAVRKLPFVRALLPFHPAFRLEPELVDAVVSGKEIGRERYVVMVVDGRLGDAGVLSRKIAQIGGHVVTPEDGNIVMEVEVDGRQLAWLMNQDEVQWIQRFTAASEDIDQARIQGGANYLEPKKAEGFTGKGVRGMIMEGVYATHPEFAATPPYRVVPLVVGTGTAANPDGHGNSTFGEVFSKGVSPLYRGLLPDGQGMYCNYNYVYSAAAGSTVPASRYGVVRDMVDPAQQYKGMFQTASWGYAQNIIYDARSAEMDNIIFTFDVPITQSQSNTGNRNSRPQAWAKNIISVGALNHYNTANPADDRISGASIGPAPDGRIKPDICAYYDQIGTTAYAATGYQTGFGGTSGATPIVAGYVGLTLEVFTDGLLGHPVAAGGWTARFQNKPHFTTTKALLVNTARQYDPAVNTGVTRIHQGWGFPSVQDLYDLRDQILAVDERDAVLNGQTSSYLVWVPSGRPQFRATMVYNDPAGAPSSPVNRINDLSLRVTAPNSSIYWGNNGLSGTGLVSTAGGTANTLDTVENVFLRNPAAGLYRVDVVGSTIVQDAKLETVGVVDADFALVVSGIGGGRDRTGMTLDLGSSGPGDFSVKLSNLPVGYTGGWTFFSATASQPLSFGHVLGIEFDALALASLAATPAAGNVFAFTATAASVYPNTTYTFPPAIAAAVAGLTFDGVAVAYDASFNVIGVSNASRVKVQ